MTPRPRHLLPIALVASVIGGAGQRVLHESFAPFALRHTFTSTEPSTTVHVPVRQPLLLEYELVVHAADGRRPQVNVRWNGREVEVPPSPPYATSRARVPLPLAATAAGDNVLHVGLDRPDSGGFEMRARLHNYRGIAPDPPRAYVVPRDAWQERVRTMPWPVRLGRAVGLTALAGLLLFALTAQRRQADATVPRAALAALAAGPTAVAMAGVFGPWHVWVAPETLALVVLGPWLLLRLVEAMRRHRVAVLGWATMVVLSIAGVEVALRLVNAVRPTFVFYADDASRFRGQPGARFFGDTFNSRGFNDRERTPAPPAAGTFRVVAIGDSFAVGVVPRGHNYLARLESALGSEGPAEVVNLGVAGTDPGDYLALLVDEGMAYAPDVVLVGFYVGNDFESRTPRWHERSFAATLVRTLWRLGRVPPQAAALDPDLAAYDDAAPGMPVERFLEIEVERSWIFERGAPRVAEAIGRATGQLAQIRDVARAGKAAVVVAILPAEAQVDPAHQRRVEGLLGRPAGGLDFAQPNRMLAEALGAAGIDAVDLLPAFDARGRTTRLYKPQDSHWNIAGNALAAEVLRPVLDDVRR